MSFASNNLPSFFNVSSNDSFKNLVSNYAALAQKGLSAARKIDSNVSGVFSDAKKSNSNPQKTQVVPQNVALANPSNKSSRSENETSNYSSADISSFESGFPPSQYFINNQSLGGNNSNINVAAVNNSDLSNSASGHNLGSIASSGSASSASGEKGKITLYTPALDPKYYSAAK
jgi:hypothetical protein